jgi:hypothetical protein
MSARAPSGLSRVRDGARSPHPVVPATARPRDAREPSRVGTPRVGTENPSSSPPPCGMTRGLAIPFITGNVGVLRKRYGSRVTRCSCRPAQKPRAPPRSRIPTSRRGGRRAEGRGIYGHNERGAAATAPPSLLFRSRRTYVTSASAVRSRPSWSRHLRARHRGRPGRRYVPSQRRPGPSCYLS